ncbi:FecR family protein [Pedobacter antarcticus]|uniref:FecR family protein n=1 Tax=Pedobacter antarcticus TaxID=34086 RepID=UPI00292FAD05|nr:FecR domain-containing protein [Pedobacter antarcticus]
MLKDQFHSAKLIAGRLNGTLDTNQEEELDQWIGSAQAHETYLQEVFYKEGQLQELLKAYEGVNESAIWKKIAVNLQPIEEPKTQVFRTITLWTKLAAAVIILITGAGLFFFIQKEDSKKKENTFANDVAPGNNTATLTLADGRRIRLTDSVSGELANTPGVVISKLANGQISYNAKEYQNSFGNQLNTLSTGKGETFQVLLPDGSKVWLNAASVLRYPVSFKRIKYRSVELLSGEAYFEVAKDKAHPFIVNSRHQRIEVLGTHFNINGYADDAKVKTTLLEGIVRVSSQAPYLETTGEKSFPRNFKPGSGNQQARLVVLKPGQQSQVSLSGISVVKDVDIGDIMAWKEGYFNFNENMESIMSKISRWYDVEVIYLVRPDPALKLRGKISRTKNLSEILNMLEYTSGMHFKIEGRRIIIEN